MAGARFEFRPADFDQDRRASRVAGDGTGSPVARHTTSTKHAAAVAATSSTSIRVNPAITKVTKAAGAFSVPIELHSAGIHERWFVYSQRDGTFTCIVGMVGDWQELTLRSVFGSDSLSCAIQYTLRNHTEMIPRGSCDKSWHTGCSSLPYSRRNVTRSVERTHSSLASPQQDSTVCL